MPCFRVPVPDGGQIREWGSPDGRPLPAPIGAGRVSRGSRGHSFPGRTFNVGLSCSAPHGW